MIDKFSKKVDYDERIYNNFINEINIKQSKILKIIIFMMN